MIEALALTAALALPASDQWDDLFDDGARWQGCRITYWAHRDARWVTLKRAMRDIRRDSGIRFKRTSKKRADVRIRVHYRLSPDGANIAAQALSTGTLPYYTSGRVTGWRPLYDRSPRWQRAVWRHELGHILGLGHSEIPGDTMYYIAGAGRIDYGQRLRALYPECKH